MGKQKTHQYIDEIVQEMEDLRKRGYGDYVTIKGCRIRYLTKGSGSPILLLHGLGGFLETWWYNIAPLSKHYRVYALDLPGHGLSDRPKDCYTVGQCTECLLGIIDALQLDTVTLVGHSLGGAIAINITVTAPQRVANLVLVDSAGLSNDVPLAFRVTTVPYLGDMVMKLAWRLLSEQAVKNLFRNSSLVSRETLATVLKVAQGPGIDAAMLRILRYNVGLIRTHNESLMLDKLPLIKAPTLLLHGAEDRIFSLDHAAHAQNLIPNANLVVFPHCGHSPHIEKPAEFNNATIKFLDISNRTPI
jgi:pimeloyl-ACP methyl ester carboxylesterase